jgi:DNA-binding NtrC family response regulator
MANPKDKEIDLLIVDDDADIRQAVVRRFERLGYRVCGAENGAEALELCKRREYDVAVLDLVMPGMSGIELLERMRSDHSECEVIMLTGKGSIETAVQAMKLGAFNFLTKPFPLAELEVEIERAYEHHQLRRENEQLRTLLKQAQPSKELVGESQPMKEVVRLIERSGPTDKAILIQGESGTGKELVARALHRSSLRANKPMVVINCAALPETLLESELFGHEKGAFTGAATAKPGLFEVADRGTLFVDEIGELAAGLQAKLLRTLEDGSLRRVGSLKERRVDVRLIAATNRDLAKEVEADKFREDLYYRINVLTIHLPPLRKHKNDIPLLVRHFLGSDWEVDPDAAKAINAYHWPGNVRQLINALERAKIMSDDRILHVEGLPPEVVEGGSAPEEDHPESDELAAIEKSHVIEVLRREGGNKVRAAEALGIHRRSLYRLLDKYGLR